MAIQVGGVTVISNNRVLQNVSGAGGGWGSVFSSNRHYNSNATNAANVSAGTYMVAFKSVQNNQVTDLSFGSTNNVRGGFEINNVGNATHMMLDDSTGKFAALLQGYNSVSNNDSNLNMRAYTQRRPGHYIFSVSASTNISFNNQAMVRIFKFGNV